MRADGILNGIAGVHLVAAELSLRGYSVAVTSRNTAGIDLFAVAPKTRKTYSIQVKTSGRGNVTNFWPLGSKPVTPHPNYFFVFVRIRNPPKPNEFYIVPSSWVWKHSSKRKTDWNSFYRSDAVDALNRWERLA